MSYELGFCPQQRPVVRRTAFRQLRGGSGVSAPISLPSQSTLGDLDFSLKPPKWLRKAQPGKILKKLAVPIAVGAALLIPGVAPAVATVARGAFGGVKAVGGAALSLFRGKPRPIGLPTGALAAAASIPASMPSPRGTLANLFGRGPIIGIGGPIGVPAQSPITIAQPVDAPFTLNPSPSTAGGGETLNVPTASVFGSGGGGGSGQTFSEVGAAPSSGVNPMWLAGGALALGLVFMLANNNRGRKGA